MRTLADLIAKPVIGITDGCKIGSVKDLYLDKIFMKGICINLNQAGLLGRKVQLIRREDVILFGIDSILT
jgi:uncharacterized protein YrrD